VCRSGVLLDQPSRSEDQTRSIRKDSAVHASLSRLHLSKSRIAKRCTPRKTSDAARCPRPSHSLVSGSIRCPTPQRQHRDEPDLGPPNLRVNTARNQNSEPADTPNRHKTIPPSSRQARMPKCPKNQPTKHRNSGAVDGANICKLARGVNTEFREFRRSAAMCRAQRSCASRRRYLGASASTARAPRRRQHLLGKPLSCRPSAPPQL
jgi:hypothetical protein